MTHAELKVAKRFKELVEERADIRKFIVFGSRACGNSALDSEMEVLIVVGERTAEVESHISDSAWEAGFGEDIVITAVVYSVSEIENSPERASIFIETVYREGVAV